MKRFFAFLCGAFLSVALLALMLSGALEAAGTNPEIMFSMMRRHAPPEKTGVDESEYPALSGMVAAYLSGGVDVFQYTDRDGHALFNEREQTHMRDVRGLFVLDRKVLMISAVVTLLMVLLLAFLSRDAGRKGALWGVAVSGLGILGLTIAGALDFSRLFIAFHRLMFTNDLWILNPETDCLIRLMPSSFFMEYAVIIAGVVLILFGAWTVFLVIWDRRAGERRKHGVS